MLSPYKIRWKNYTSIELDLWVGLSFDSDNGEVDTYLNRAAVASESYNGTLKRVHGYKWEQTFTPKFTFIKQNYEDFTPEENRKILTWLTSSVNAEFLDVYRDNADTIDFSLLGNFITVNQYKLGNGRVVGYVAEFESVTPWALSPLQTITKEIWHPTDTTIVINLATDEPQSAVYPRITLTHEDLIVSINGTLDLYSNMTVNTVYFNDTMYYWKTPGATKCNSTTKPDYEWPVIEVDHQYTDEDKWESGVIYHNETTSTYFWIDPYDFHENAVNPNLKTTGVLITNTHTDNNQVVRRFETFVTNNLRGETVVLDGANRVVSSSRPIGRVFGDDFKWQWIPLYEGKNELSFLGNCTVTIEYRYPMKTGEF